jgi:hypothetical protein
MMYLHRAKSSNAQPTTRDTTGIAIAIHKRENGAEGWCSREGIKVGHASKLQRRKDNDQKA